MVSLDVVIRWLRPEAVAPAMYQVGIVSGEEAITYWSAALGTQPTPAEIEAARLPAERASVIAAIKAERLRLQLERGFPVQTPSGLLRFHSDSHSRTQHAGIFAAVLLALLQGGNMTTPLQSNGQPVMWSPITGPDVALTVGIGLALLSGAMWHENAVHQAAKAHIAAVNASETPLAYDWSGGWPE